MCPNLSRNRRSLARRASPQPARGVDDAQPILSRRAGNWRLRRGRGGDEERRSGVQRSHWLRSGRAHWAQSGLPVRAARVLTSLRESDACIRHATTGEAIQLLSDGQVNRVASRDDGRELLLRRCVLMLPEMPCPSKPAFCSHRLPHKRKSSFVHLPNSSVPCSQNWWRRR